MKKTLTTFFLILALGMIPVTTFAAIFNENSADIENTYLISPLGTSLIRTTYGESTTKYEYIHIVGTEIIDGVECVRVISLITEAVEFDETWLAQDINDDVFCLKYWDSTDEDPTPVFLGQDGAGLIMPKNPKVGDIISGGEEIITHTGVTVPQLSTGLGPFSNCIRTIGDDDDIHWYAPGYGEIKREEKESNYNSGLELKEIIVPQSTHPREVIIPVFKHQPDYWSGLGISNLSAAKQATVTVTVYNSSGSRLTTESKTIPANGQSSFLVGTKLNEDGWIKINSDQELAGLCFLGEYEINDVDYYLANVPFTDTVSKLLLIPHVAQNSQWDTVVCLANPNGAIARVTLTYTSKNGSASIPYTTTIPANGSKEVSVETIANSSDVKGGRVTISSTQSLTAFALYNNLKTGRSGYAGITAVDISE